MGCCSGADANANASTEANLGFQPEAHLFELQSVDSLLGSDGAQARAHEADKTRQGREMSCHWPDRQPLTARLLGPCLLLSQIANNRYLNPFTVKGVDHHNEPRMKSQTHHRPHQ